MTAQVRDAASRGARRRVLLVAVLVSVAGVAPAIMLGAVAVQLQSDLDVSERFVGMVFSGYFVVAAVAAGRGGRLADRIGWMRAVDVVAVASTVFLVGIVASPTSRVFAIVMVASGVVQGLAGAVGSLVLSRGLPRGRAGLAFGVMQAAVPLSSLAGGALVPTVAVGMGWRPVYAVMVVVPLGAALATRHAARFPYPPTPAATAATRPETLTASRPPRRVALAGGVATLGNATLGAFLVTSLVAAGSSESVAALGLVVASVVALAVRLVGGWLIDRRELDGLRSTALLSVVAAAGFALMVGDDHVTRTIGGVVAFGAGWGWSGMLLHWVSRRHPGRTGTAVGGIQRGFSAGAALGPLVAGSLVGAVGFPVIWTVSAVTAVAASWMFASPALKYNAL